MTTDKVKELLKAGLHYEESNDYYWLNVTPYTEEEFEKLLSAPEPTIEPDKEVSVEKHYNRFKEDFIAHADRLLRDRGASNKDVFDCLEMTFEDMREYASLREHKLGEEDYRGPLFTIINKHLSNEPVNNDDPGIVSAMKEYAAYEVEKYKHGVGEEKDLDSSLGNSDKTSVASHNSSVGNTNEQ
jgi:hypothetical protein